MLNLFPATRHPETHSYDSGLMCPELAKMIVDQWLVAEFEGGRHQRRIDMIAEIEQTQELTQIA